MPDNVDSENIHVNGSTNGGKDAGETELDEFGLPRRVPERTPSAEGLATYINDTHDTDVRSQKTTSPQGKAPVAEDREDNKQDEDKDANSSPSLAAEDSRQSVNKGELPSTTNLRLCDTAKESTHEIKTEAHLRSSDTKNDGTALADGSGPSPPIRLDKDVTESRSKLESKLGHQRNQSSISQGISEWSHQQAIVQPVEVEQKVEEEEWQTMPAFAPFDMYDDDNRLIAREHVESDHEDGDKGLGGAGKGYTRIQVDEDAESATSLDENTQYLFKELNGTSAAGPDDDEQRDAVSQMQATKDLLTEGQRIAYVGMTRLAMSSMLKDVELVGNRTKGSRKQTALAVEAMKMWSQKMMVRLYAHMDINAAEQIMIEQLAEHGVEPADMTPTLMQNARVKNPMAETAPSTSSLSSPRPRSVTSFEKSPRDSISFRAQEEEAATPPPAYVEHEGDDLPEVRTPSQLPTTKNIDIDLRWTVLCDLFLVLIADSVYDSRSRVLLERVGAYMDVSWLEICRFEKRVTDALEMQQAAEKENWNEDEHKENRRKLALKKRYMVMGLATVGGSLVIGLSAGLLAPVIGAGLAAGFTTIGVAGTSGFLAGAGGAAIITSTAAASGGVIGVRAAERRTGAVKTFEYRPLHNNKRVNLIVTVSGWMTGKVDDVRLPYSTVDPIMGDIYSVLWEPEMLSSMGDTINILATEALTQGLQQVLGSTILIGLMAALQLPVILTKLAYLIDNPWTVSLDRANAAGLILADSLIDRNLGTRPITLVGYSLGSRVIFSCLHELARKGAFGLVQNVYLFGSPIVAKKDEYLKARAVVAGRFVNGYAKNDWILGYLFRLTSGGISRVAGLAPVEDIPGLENIDVTSLVPGHMSYRTAMPKLLREMGWAVESDEFSEIEDPDPENHQQRQRELINEIEEARKEFEKQEQGSKGKFGFFSRKKKNLVEKKEWETYQESQAEASGRGTEDVQGNNHGVLFDIDAIRAELASEQMEVKELQSTLPPMKLDLGTTPTSPRSTLRETKSYDPSMAAPLPSSLTPPPPVRSPMSWDVPPHAAESSPHQPYLHPEGAISMTFDTAYQRPARSSSSIAGPRAPPSPSSPSVRIAPPLAEPTDRAAMLQRPELKSSTTLPVLPPGHNVWADDDDEFKEKEMEMTFA
ncbi:MAG: hypothetical protein M1818_008094 [Claussenomyces sp. TS43310]|nr:MAG: hypothetical protein M1818_008094 [Claussenomyces sp. TS43310]